MKKEIEEQKNEDFFYWLNWHFLEYFNLADFKSTFRFFVSFLGQKFQPLGVGLKRPKTIKLGQNGPTPKVCNFWSKEDMKNLNVYLKSVGLKYSKSVN